MLRSKDTTISECKNIKLPKLTQCSLPLIKTNRKKRVNFVKYYKSLQNNFKHNVLFKDCKTNFKSIYKFLFLLNEHSLIYI